MKTVFHARFLLLAGTTLLLAACGIGGGGGGGSSGPESPLTLERMVGWKISQKNPASEDHAAFDTHFSIGEAESGTRLGALAVRNPDGEKIIGRFENGDFCQYFGDAGTVWLGASQSLSVDTVSKNPNVFRIEDSTGPLTSSDWLDILFGAGDSSDGPIFYDQMLFINDRNMGAPLDYATFGAWAYSYTLDKTMHYVYVPFYGGPDARKIQPGDRVYTGQAHAEFAQPGAGVYDYRSGKAMLTVEGSGHTGTLDLVFSGAYDIRFKEFTISDNGGFSASGQPVITSNGNTTGISGMDDKAPDYWRTVQLKGNFYSGKTAPEAAGTFNLANGGAEKTIKGSFGVK